jgi:hypothetical protein
MSVGCRKAHYTFVAWLKLFFLLVEIMIIPITITYNNLSRFVTQDVQVKYCSDSLSVGCMIIRLKVDYGTRKICRVDI